VTVDAAALLDAVAELGTAALGATLVMIAGEIDLSIGAVFALAPTVAATLMERGLGFAPAVLAGLLAGLLVGACNAAGAMLRVPGVAVSLVAGAAAAAAVWRLDIGFPPLLPADVPAWLFAGRVAGPVRASLLWFAAAAVLAGMLLALGPGRAWREAGRRAPRAPVRGARAVAFLLSAVLAGLAGTMQMLRVGSPLPGMGIGPGWQALAAALIGGAFPWGGLGSAAGTAVGTIVLAGILVWLADRPLLADSIVLVLVALAAAVGLLRTRRRGKGRR
jgi:simple sugar transport system permease protein